MKNERYSRPYAITSFFSLTDMSHGRATHGCGTISAQDGSGNKEVVVAGDYNYLDKNVEIYSIANDSWRAGNTKCTMQNEFELSRKDSRKYFAHENL